MNKMSFAVATALCLSSTAPAFADIIQGSANQGFQIDAFEPLGQSFTAVDAQIQTIGFKLFVINSPFPNDSPLQVDLFSGEGTGGALIASRTALIPDGANDGFFTNFNFSGTSLTVGQTYSAVLTIVGNSPYLGVQVNASDPYEGGKLFSPEPLTTQICGASGCDLAFQVLGSNAVPEPASWAMMIGGFALAGTAARRRGLVKATA